LASAKFVSLAAVRMRVGQMGSAYLVMVSNSYTSVIP